MNRKFNLGYIFLSLCVATVVSCSSNDKKDEAASPDVAEATSDAGAPADQSADANAAPADPNAAPPADAAAAPPAGSEADMAANNAPPTTADANALDANNTAPAPADPNATPADPNAAPPTDAAAAPPATADANAAPSDPNAAPPTDAAAAPPAAGDQNQTDLFGAASTDAASTAPSDAAPVHHVSIAHIKDAPFTKGGQNLNTVYIARDGDTLESISQKLFGEDRTKQLKKANPTLKKSVKTGDKVYFNSPARPDDKEKMLTVYEDQGLPPASYTTKDGDTLKSLAQEWYGSEDSYKEIYAINRTLASTKDLPAGTELQYWPAAAQVAVYGAKKEPDVAQAAPPPPNNAPPAGGMLGQDPNANPNNMPPPPPAQNNNAMMPPPPPPGQMDNGNMPGGAAGMAQPPGAAANNGLPPPPAPDQMAPPPPMNASRHKTKDLTSSSMAGMDKDTIMYAAAAGVLLIGSGFLIAIRRRNSRKNSGVTQV